MSLARLSFRILPCCGLMVLRLSVPIGAISIKKAMNPLIFTAFKLKHKADDIEAELLAIVDNGGRVQNIMIEHPVYGEIQTYLKLTCRRDVQQFLEQVSESDFRALSELTNGVHYHLIEADSQQDLDYIERALAALGFLQE